MVAPLLSVKDLSIQMAGAENALVDRLSFDVRPGETVCVVGESGCGKSLTALALMGLLSTPPLSIRAGTAHFAGEDLLTMPEAARRDIRGGQMAMIFQEPMTSLNPAIPVGEQIAEAVRRHQRLGTAAARAHALAMLTRVRIPAPEKRLDEYPHQLSGGMRQRAMIAMALANDPKLLIADEPTTALDVTIQAQILDLIRALQAESGTALILITHDLGVVAEMADTVVVMYAGRVVEAGPAAALFEDPQHPYTIGLMSSMPSLGARTERLVTIPGVVPPPTSMPTGCRFMSRCPFAIEDCREAPPLTAVGPSHTVACLRAPLEATAASALEEVAP